MSDAPWVTVALGLLRRAAGARAARRRLRAAGAARCPSRTRPGPSPALSAEPVAAPPLVELVRDALAAAPGGEVVIVDPRRLAACPTPVILERLLAELGRRRRAGRPHRGRRRLRPARDHVRGRKSAPSWAPRRHRRRGDRRAGHREPQTVASARPPWARLRCVARRVAEAALVIAVGVVEPHLYAGFSGGVKAVAIGCAGEATIAWTHRPAFISRPGVVLGRLDGNPFQETLREVAARTPLQRRASTPWSTRRGAS